MSQFCFVLNFKNTRKFCILFGPGEKLLIPYIIEVENLTVKVLHYKMQWLIYRLIYFNVEYVKS